MKDALGAVQSILVLGGTSDIAIATVEKLVTRAGSRVVLAGRNLETLEVRAEALRSSGAAVTTTRFDASDFASHEDFVKQAFADGGFDLVIAAFGVLGDQQAGEADPMVAVDVVQANFTGAVSVLLHVANRLKAQGRGTIVVLSSMAGERVRKDNFIYGSTKAALDGFSQGLGDSLAGTGVNVVVVRPGFVETKMTAGMGKKPMSTTADVVADATVKGIASGAHTVWAPGTIRYAGIVLRHLPRFIFRRINAG